MSQIIVAALSPQVLGPIIVVAFIAIVVLCVIADKKAGKKFLEKMASEYVPTDSFGDIFTTAKNELLLPLGSGTLPGYKKWNLSEVVGIKTDSKGNFAFLDANNKLMKGEYLSPSKKPLKEKSYVNFKVKSGDVENFVKFVAKSAPHIKWYN